MGTLWFSDTALLDQRVSNAGGTLSDINGYIAFGSTNVWKPIGLTDITDASIGLLSDTGLHFTNDLLIADATVIVNTNAALLQFDGALSMTNASTLTVYAGMADTYSGVDFGNEISIGGAFTLYSDSWYVPVSHPTNGGSVRLQAASLTVEEGGGVNANMAGFRSYANVAYGPGFGKSSGSRGGGGGYGGVGGRGANVNSHGGDTYGETNRPLHPGSAGGFGHTPNPGGGNGGGYVRIDTGPMVLNGTISANGRTAGTYGGGGSGGGIFILCDSLEGSASGLISARGGNGGSVGGGGGGGRVAVSIGMSPADRAKLIAGDEVDGLFVYTSHGPYLGWVSVTNGTTPAGHTPLPEPGTAVFMTVAAGTYALVVEGDPGNYGTPQPQNYGTTIAIPADSILTNSVATPADEANGLRRACIGWRLTDESETLVDEDTTAQAVFTLSSNRILTWNWTNEYQLVVEAGPDGSVNNEIVDGWYTSAVSVAGIEAEADPGYIFMRWIGDVPLVNQNDNPLTLLMDQPRTVQAEFASLSGQEKTWTGTGNWTDAGNWDPSGAPGPNDQVTIASGNVLLQDSQSMQSLRVAAGATLTLTNWNTQVSVTNAIEVAGLVTIASAFGYPSSVSNRVWLTSGSLHVEAGGEINVDAKGYLVGTGPAKGAQSSSNNNAGGGHGGRGGDEGGGLGGPEWGVADQPVWPGSGGGQYLSNAGGNGGGVIRIEAEHVSVNGTISANGQNGSTYNGGGAGGAIWITCTTFAATNGIILANGGNGGSAYAGGGAGGGRLAVDYQTTIGECSIVFSTRAGAKYSNFPAGMGTLWLPDTVLVVNGLASRFDHVRVIVPDFTSLTLGSLALENRTFALGEEGFLLNVTGDLTLRDDAHLTLGAKALSVRTVIPEGAMPESTNISLSVGGHLRVEGATLVVGGRGQLGMSQIQVGGDMILATNASVNTARLFVCSGATNELTASGGVVDIAGALLISSNAWYHPVSHPTNGGSVRLQSAAVTIDAGGGVNANAAGFLSYSSIAYGYGAGMSSGSRGGGGGYGGEGGRGAHVDSHGGGVYGITNSPQHTGSAGAFGHSPQPGYGHGGGYVRIETGSLTLNGLISANGRNSVSQYGGGGSGGGILLICDSLQGSDSGRLEAHGGNGGNNGGAGGGGRIAVWLGFIDAEGRASLLADGTADRLMILETLPDYEGTATALAGTISQVPAEDGTVVFLRQIAPSGTMFMFR